MATATPSANICTTELYHKIIQSIKVHTEIIMKREPTITQMFPKSFQDMLDQSPMLINADQ